MHGDAICRRTSPAPIREGEGGTSPARRGEGGRRTWRRRRHDGGSSDLASPELSSPEADGAGERGNQERRRESASREVMGWAGMGWVLKPQNHHGPGKIGPNITKYGPTRKLQRRSDPTRMSSPSISASPT